MNAWLRLHPRRATMTPSAVSRRYPRLGPGIGRTQRVVWSHRPLRAFFIGLLGREIRCGASAVAKFGQGCPHSRRAADWASLPRSAAWSAPPARSTNAEAIANTVTPCLRDAVTNSCNAASVSHRRRPMSMPSAVSMTRRPSRVLTGPLETHSLITFGPVLSLHRIRYPGSAR